MESGERRAASGEQMRLSSRRPRLASSANFQPQAVALSKWPGQSATCCAPFRLGARPIEPLAPTNRWPHRAGRAVAPPLRVDGLWSTAAVNPNQLGGGVWTTGLRAAAAAADQFRPENFAASNKFRPLGQDSSRDCVADT